MVEIHENSVSELSYLVKSQSISAKTVFEHFVKRIKSKDEDIGAFVELANFSTIDNFNGMVISVKSNIAVKGFRHTAGMKLYKDNVATEDAKIIKLLRKSGAIFVGIVNMEEAAVGAKTDNPFFGKTHNPIKRGYTPGGSSGGSAASVAARFCNISLGTDTLGSSRIPAAYCGLWGLKPSKGVIPKDGLIPLCEEFDEIGPIASKAEDILEFMGIFAQRQNAPVSAKISVLNKDHAAICEPLVFDKYIGAISQLRYRGHEIIEVEFEFDLTKLRRSALFIALHEASNFFARPLREAPDCISKPLKSLFQWAQDFDENRKLQAIEMVASAKNRVKEIMKQTDFLLSPTTPHTAFSHEIQAPVSQADYTSLANIAGLPAINIPVFDKINNLPVGIQLMGKIKKDMELIEFAKTNFSD